MRSRRDSCRVAFLLLYVLLALSADDKDVQCLQGIKASLDDPGGHLSWNFSNASVGFACNFDGVQCSIPRGNRVITLRFPFMSLSGRIPPALQFCSAATGLYLEGNSLSGPIPPDICRWLPLLGTLDLSGNNLSGPIPPELFNCRLLVSLNLSSNSLSGQIPASLSRFETLVHLNLSHNHLSGEIPPSVADLFYYRSSFESNAGLCGRPLSTECSSHHSPNRAGLVFEIAAGVLGAAVALLIAYAVWCFCLSADSNTKSGEGDVTEWWAQRLQASSRFAPVLLFQKPIVKLKFSDLMAATGDFHPDHITAAGSARAGTSYKVVLPDGSALTVKRLHGCALGENQFRAEMNRLGKLRHPNLAPLLGFCIVDDDRLLIYKHMANGVLSSHLSNSTTALNWPARLRIAICAARGLAWLHHGFQTPFLHQHISSTTVLLDEECEARITDFGMPGLITSWPTDPTTSSLFLTGDFGEFGYLPPEYATNPIATVGVDIFAFGVVLLELATGQKSTQISAAGSREVFKIKLVDWIHHLSATNRMLDSLDSSLRGKGNEDAILELLTIAMKSVASRPQERPSMYNIYQSLKNIGDGHDFSQQFDEFPLVYGRDDSDSTRASQFERSPRTVERQGVERS